MSADETGPVAASQDIAGVDVLIRARRLARGYRMGESEVRALRGVDLDIPRGALVVLKGESGSGKSTLLSLLAGLDTPSEGELVVAGRDMTRLDEAGLTTFRREIVGMVFQSFNLMPTLTVLENVCLPALLAGRDEAAAEGRARDLLDGLGLGKRLAHTPDRLSGGEMQRTAIARALILDPPLILADEPTGNLDSKSGHAVVELLAGLSRREGRTVVLATHSDMADYLADLRLCLADGLLVEDACPA